MPVWGAPLVQCRGISRPRAVGRLRAARGRVTGRGARVRDAIDAERLPTRPLLVGLIFRGSPVRFWRRRCGLRKCVRCGSGASYRRIASIPCATSVPAHGGFHSSGVPPGRQSAQRPGFSTLSTGACVRLQRGSADGRRSAPQRGFGATIDACRPDLYTSPPLRALGACRSHISVFYFAPVELLPRRRAISEGT
jgi:hypothetical protein